MAEQIGETLKYQRPNSCPLSDLRSNSHTRPRRRILKWFCDSSRDCSIFWVIDPFTVRRESTVFRAFTGIFEALNRLGALTLGSYEESRQDSEPILTVVYQLASKYPPYRSLLMQELVDDPMILKKSPRILFKTLITKPWDKLATSHPVYLQRPLLIFVEFRWYLDCRNDTEFVDLIQEYASSRKNGPLLWLICSHPRDRQVQLSFSTIDVRPLYEHETWSYDDSEAKQDVKDLLHTGFQKIRRNHPAIFDEDERWPSKTQLTKLTGIISGISHFACAVLHFIGAEGKDPKKRLETCLECMDGSPAASPLNPFSTFDHFYHQLLSRMPPGAIDLLGLFLQRGMCSPLLLANLLGMDQTEFHAIFSDNLYPILDISSDGDTRYGGEMLELQDGTFGTFFWEAVRSGAISDPHPSFIKRCLCIPSYCTLSAVVSWMKWKPSQEKVLCQSAYRLQGQANAQLWLNPSGRNEGYAYFNDFDFRTLVHGSACMYSFAFYGFLVRLQVTCSQLMSDSSAEML